MKAPFPFFGGKSSIAPVVWGLFGDDIGHFIEPFAGSLAVLLARPDWQGKVETVNDADCYISNFWRAVQAAPDEVAKHASWPVNECDLHSRHKWLIDQAEFRAKMLADPDYYDSKIAGWWVWGISQWIGGEWCKVSEKRRPYVSTGGRGVHRLSDREPSQQIPSVNNGGKGIHSLSDQRPHLDNGGVGVHAKGLWEDWRAVGSGKGVHRPPLQEGEVPHRMPMVSGNDGRGIDAQMRRGRIYEIMEELQVRLRYVRVLCGDWSRVVTPALTYKNSINNKPIAVFLDPPYLGVSDRLYSQGKNDTALQVLDWCMAHWEHPRMRIVLAEYEGNLPIPEGWKSVAWTANMSYASKKGNRERERLWYSPACIAPGETIKQMGF